MKIKILKPSGLTYWYANMIGDELEVNYYINEGAWPFRTEVSTRYLKNSDCVITELPKSFSVKRCDDKEKWKKYIDWLNKTYFDCYMGGCDGYYGSIEDSSCYEYMSFGTEIHIDDMIKHIDYMERHIKGGEQFHKESQLTVKMNTQRLSRKGLKEIHSVACSSWKILLEQFGRRNPLEDYIELSQEEVNNMFNACNIEQLPIVSKYLKQDDGSVDVTKFNVSGKGFCDDNFYIIRDREWGEYKKQSFLLSERYNWEIKTDKLGQLCLIPTRKK